MIALRPQQARFATRLATAALAFAAALGAQTDVPASRAGEIVAARERKAEAIQPELPGKLEQQLNRLQENQIIERFGLDIDGFFPKFGGLATGHGFAAGAQYRQKGFIGNAIDFRASAVGSFTESYRFDLGVSAPRVAGGRVGLDFLARHRNLSQIDFYGLGPDSELEDRTSFRMEDTSYDLTAVFKPITPYLHFGLHGGGLQVNTGRGLRDDFPSTEERFSQAQIPGLADQTNFLRAGGLVRVDSRDYPAGPRSGSLLSADWSIYRDLNLNRHDFQRLDLEAQHYIPFYNKRRVILLRARSVLHFTDDDQTVPFYLKPWIGGPVELRGFRNYRFYDDNVLMLNAEYRWEAFSGLDMALFFDAGQVAAKRDAFALDKMETAAGFGFRFNVRNTTFLRLDFAFSHESFRMWFRFGDPF